MSLAHDVRNKTKWSGDILLIHNRVDLHETKGRPGKKNLPVPLEYFVSEAVVVGGTVQKKTMCFPGSSHALPPFCSSP